MKDFTNISVTFETITPLWTGDAWMENNQIRPSSIMGSLRFWFEVYRKLNFDEDLKLNNKNIPNETVDYKSLMRSFKARLASNKEKSVDELLDNALAEQEISVSSRIFGCTNWKSRVKIKNVKYTKKQELKIDKIKKDYLVNAEFWIKKSLFDGKNKLMFWENITFDLKIKNYWFESYFKFFLECINNQIFLVGGKKSFGFGITKILIPGLKKDTACQSILDAEGILINHSEIKNDFILGFNFRYFLRKQRTNNKFYKIVNFGKQEKATKIYISNKSIGSNQIWFIYFENPFDSEYIKENVLITYKNILK